MPQYTKRFWSYPIFQIPAFLSALFFTLALLTHLQGWFTPAVAVQAALDLSGSTYNNNSQYFRSQGTVMEGEINAIKEYALRNATLPNPNLISLSAFADKVLPVTPNFSPHSEEINTAIDKIIQPSILPLIGGGTNFNVTVESGLNSLNSQPGKCKEMLVITDGISQLDSAQVDGSVKHQVRLNFLIVGPPVPPELEKASHRTGGVAISANSDNISALVSGRLFNRFNSNWPAVQLFLAAAGVSLMWMLILPLDRWLQDQMKLRFDHSSLMALLNAIFWTIIGALSVGSLNLFRGC